MPIQIDVEKIRAASQRLKQMAPSADDFAKDIERAASDAKSANDGFLTADACEDFAERTNGTSATLGGHVGAMADPIADSAKAWEDVDEENASEIGKQSGELGKVKG
ncbi:type VII secretion target [Glycomyces sp. NPDC046736]|uniref:type VII secretion target n=1 Tax=Glycomyces sp. NPDC046736 TaxID=3155615 RepID=UPI0033FD582E